MSKTLKVSILLGLLLSSSGCLRTRAQVKEEDDTDAKVEKTAVTTAANSSAVDELKQELNRLNGRIEDLERSQAQAGKDGPAAKDEYKKLEGRIVELEQAQMMVLETLKKNQASAPAADPQNVFQRGKTLYGADDFEGAIENLGKYIQSAPSGSHIQEATFLRAEAYFKTKQYKKAIVDYGKFNEKFTKSSHLPAALYQLGRCFELLGMKEDSKAFYQELTDKFPKSAEAKKVRGGKSSSKLK